MSGPPVSAQPNTRVAPKGPLAIVRVRSLATIPILVGAFGLLLLVYFDLGPPLAFNDDWMYSWSVRQLGLGHGLRLFPEASPTALVQIFWGACASLGRADPHLLRLSAIPFLALGGYSSARLAANLGADRFWSRMAGVALFGAPISMGIATGFMTDGFYIGLLLADAVCSARWLRSGKGAPLALVVALLAVLQRQVGAVIPVAVSIGLLTARRRRTVDRLEWIWLALLWVLTLGALALPFGLGIATPNMRIGGGGPMAPSPVRLLEAVLRIPLIAGLGFVPFLVGLLSKRQARPGFGTLLAGAWIAAALVFFHSFADDNAWTPSGLNPVTLASNKPRLFDQVVPAAGILGVATFFVLFLRRRTDWAGVVRRPEGVFLLVLALLQLLPVLQLRMQFRYFLPCLALLVPVVAALATTPRYPRAAAGWAVAVLLIGVGVYAAGEQDYQAWQVARDRAARQAFAIAQPAQVDAGYEVAAVYVEIPMYDATGLLPGPVGDFLQPSLIRVNEPRVTLFITGPDDSRPGVAYNSLAPGKVVIIRH